MKVTQAEIVISAVQQSQYPEDNLPEIVLLGRSNVGKSSFININHSTSINITCINNKW